MKIENIFTERYILRKVEKDDSNEIFGMLSNPETIENLNMQIHKSIKDTESMIDEYFLEYEQGKKFPYAIIEKNTNTFVGVFLILKRL